MSTRRTSRFKLSRCYTCEKHGAYINRRKPLLYNGYGRDAGRNFVLGEREIIYLYMFPQTDQIETLVHLSKKSQISHIEVDVEFGEGEGQFSLKKVKQRAEERKSKEKVTYKMIKDHIEHTYGFKVHTAYIAEVKRDLGLPV